MSGFENQLDVPSYVADDSNDSDDLNESDESVTSSKQVTASVSVEEYDDDDVPTAKLQEKFQVAENENVFLIDFERDSILIGLKEKQRIFISGVFKLQVVKGGIVYNNVHYNASSEIFTMWHPLCNSIPAINSSFFAGWEEACHIDARNREVVIEDLKAYPCVIKAQNASIDNLFTAGSLFYDVRYLWKNRSSFTQRSASENCTYHILVGDIDPFTPLYISDEWSSNIEKLTMIHKSSLYDTRVMVLGGKNSGKSTFLRLLTENFLYSGDKQRSDDEILYLDLDSGQPEFSDPDCISLNRISRGSKVLGRHLGQPHFEALKECYVGATSPQDIPDLYLKCVTELMKCLEDQNYMGTSLVNLPGWIKGFGLNILNHIISKFKPTHIVILESKGSKKHLEELKLDSHFSTSSRCDYTSIITKISGASSNPEDFKFHAPSIRTFRTLAYFHTLRRGETGLKYDFTPLVYRPPLQISFGSSGIRGIQFPEEFEDLHEDDIKTALEGTIVGLHTLESLSTDDVTLRGAFPLITKQKQHSQFISLVLIHSVDVNNNYMNVYLPEFKLEKLNSDTEKLWMMVRGRSETPLCEIFPTNNVFSSQQIPYLSLERRKKHEHVWKVRKNVLRRGHHMK